MLNLQSQCLDHILTDEIVLLVVDLLLLDRLWVLLKHELLGLLLDELLDQCLLLLRSKHV